MAVEDNHSRTQDVIPRFSWFSVSSTPNSSRRPSIDQVLTSADPIPLETVISEVAPDQTDAQSGGDIANNQAPPTHAAAAFESGAGRPQPAGNRRSSSGFLWNSSFTKLGSDEPMTASRSRKAPYLGRRHSTLVHPLPTDLSARRASDIGPRDVDTETALNADNPATAPPLLRRSSLLNMSRRGSAIWQTAYGDAERPGYIRRGSTVIRSASSNSLQTFSKWSGAPQRRISVFEEDLDLHRADILEYIAKVKTSYEKNNKPSRWKNRATFFPIIYIACILAFIYLFLVGLPLWNGFFYTYYRYFKKPGKLKLGTIIFVGWAGIQAFVPVLFGRYEQEVDPVESRDSSEVALVIPAYKAAAMLPQTIEHALKIYKKEQIFIIANGNSKEPTDNTAEVCAEWGVNHYWVPIGSKITAEFVGVAVASKYKYVMLIDDDVHLPANLPIVTNRFNKVTKCIGYTIKSTGQNGVKGTYIQQCQDIEYKASGLSRTWAGTWGSTSFPHGAIILWEREALQSLFSSHPGYVISEDWYFGYIARQAGYRIAFCSQVFVETETPPCLLWDRASSRGGYGEMTVWKQRFYRWNYFFLFRIWHDSKYLLFNWRLGWRECTAKYETMIELVNALVNLLRPFVFVISLYLDARLVFEYMAILMLIYGTSFIMFNCYHLRRKHEMVSFKVLPTYFFMKFVLLWFSTASMYYGLFHYVTYFSKKHHKVVENHEALEAAYRIRMGTRLEPVAGTLEKLIEEVEQVQEQQREEGEGDAPALLSTESCGDLEKGMIVKAEESCVSDVRVVTTRQISEDSTDKSGLFDRYELGKARGSK